MSQKAPPLRSRMEAARPAACPRATHAGITRSEAAGLLADLAVIAAVSALMYGVYRLTLAQVCRTLHLHTSRRSP